MKGSRWSDEKLTEALEQFALSGNIRATSKQVSVPESTIRRWLEQHAKRVEAIKRRNAEIGQRAIEESLEQRMAEIAEFGRDIRLKALELLPNLRRATPSGVAALGRAAVEIEFKGLGRPSEVLELRGKVIDEAIERELEKLARAKEEAVSSEPGPSAEED